jgi:tRNA modification GTPase
VHGASEDTIVALATAPGAGALAVVRLSGPGAAAVGSRIFRGPRSLDTLRGSEGAHGWIHDGAAPVDEVVAWVYRAPRSYTGEDMLEISCHGGALPAARVVETACAAGARPALPGEFTRRAFLNGRIDLTQAEAVADLIAARGRRAQDQALLQLEGGLARRIRSLADALRGVLADIEAHLDFGDDVPRAPRPEAMDGALRHAEAELVRLAESHAPSRRAREGAVVVITGRPNVGKSSLLNALCGADRAIVHDAPGTTRDVVEASVEWAGIPVRLVDTAGIRNGVDPVEREGVARSRSVLRGADSILWVVDASVPPAPEDAAVAATLDWSRVHLVLNKMDLLNGGRTGWVNGYSPRSIHRTSATRGTGIGDLHRTLETELTSGPAGSLDHEDIWVANARHARELAEAARFTCQARRILAGGEPLELGAADLHRALDHLAAVTGDQAGSDLLDAIFRRFCIGK